MLQHDIIILDIWGESTFYCNDGINFIFIYNHLQVFPYFSNIFSFSVRRVTLRKHLSEISHKSISPDVPIRASGGKWTRTTTVVWQYFNAFNINHNMDA